MNITYDSNWIRVVDQALESGFCDHLIQRFNRIQHRSTRRQDYPHLWEINLWHKGYRDFTAQELMRGHTTQQDFTEECDYLVDRVYELSGDYRSRWDVTESFPQDYTMEGFRIKAYRAGTGDGFPIHVDAKGRNMCSRFLAFLFYLNDSDAGTEFPMENMTVEAKQGRLLMFPPGLQWPHLGQEPQTQDKYILSTYLHFI